MRGPGRLMCRSVQRMPSVRHFDRNAVAATPAVAVNLGYACLNCELRERSPSVFTNRTCVQRTFHEKGLAHVSKLALQNVQDLAKIIEWNQAHDIYFFRLSSVIFPWSGAYRLSQLPDFELIAQGLQEAGAAARAAGCRLTSHPDHFTKIASPVEATVAKSLAALETQSEVFDLLGFEHASAHNKINIHVGGVYGDKAASLQRFAAAVRRLSPRCRSRLTVENDDIPNSYCVDDLYAMSMDVGVPIVFDLHHQRFCKGAWSDREALERAVSTWPSGVKPVVHWSESQAGRRPHAHSDYVHGPLDLYGFDVGSVDIMIEAKMKERALLQYRESMLARACTC